MSENPDTDALSADPDDIELGRLSAEMPDVHSIWIMWTGTLDDVKELRPDWIGVDHFQLRGALERALDYVNENFFTPPGEGDCAT